MEVPWTTLLVCCAAALAGGLVKGVLGVGLPLVAVPMVSTVLSVREAVVLLSVPTMASNFLQTFEGGRFGLGLRRFWPLLLALCVGIALGTRFLVHGDPRAAQGILGTIVIFSALASAFPPRASLSPRLQAWSQPAVGFFAGLIGGVSSFFGPPILAYLVTLRLPRDEFVSSISLVYFVGAFPLYAGLVLRGGLEVRDLALSLLLLLPVAGGLLLGRWVRLRIEQRTFQQALLALLLAIGLNLLRKAAAPS